MTSKNLRSVLIVSLTSSLLLLGGCAQMVSLTDSVWGTTKTLGKNTGMKISQLLRPAPKQIPRFDGDEPASEAVITLADKSLSDVGLVDLSLADVGLVDLSSAPEPLARVDIVDQGVKADHPYDLPIQTIYRPQRRASLALGAPASKVYQDSMPDLEIAQEARLSQVIKHSQEVKAFQEIPAGQEIQAGQEKQARPQARPGLRPRSSALSLRGAVDIDKNDIRYEQELVGAMPEPELVPEFVTELEPTPQPEDSASLMQDFSYVKIGGGSTVLDWQYCQAHNTVFAPNDSSVNIDAGFDLCMRGKGYVPESEAVGALKPGQY